MSPYHCPQQDDLLIKTTRTRQHRKLGSCDKFDSQVFVYEVKELWEKKPNGEYSYKDTEEKTKKREEYNLELTYVSPIDQLNIYQKPLWHY